MQAQAYEGYFESGMFYTAGKPLQIPERRKVYITILDEITQVESIQGEVAKNKREKNEPGKDEPALNNLPNSAPEWLKELHHLLEESSDEKLNIEDFPRFDFGREPIIFSNED